MALIVEDDRLMVMDIKKLNRKLHQPKIIT